MARFILVVVILLVSLAYAVGSGFTLLYRFSYLLALLLVFGFIWSHYILRGINVVVERRFRNSTVGEHIEERISVNNLWLFPKPWFEVEDKTDLPGFQTGRVISLGAKGYRTWLSRVQCTRRGEFTVGPLVATASDPFRIFRLSKTFGKAQRLLVYPAVVELPYFYSPRTRLAGEAPTRRSIPHNTPSASSVREYAPGDNLSRIHWSSTAHTGRLMTKEFDLEPASDMWIVVDMEQSVQAGEGVESTEEYAVTIAASLANKFLSQDVPVGILLSGKDTLIVRSERGQQHLDHLMESLAVVKADGKLGLPESIESNVGRFGTASSLVILTPNPTERLGSVLSQLSSRGIKSSVIILDVASFGKKLDEDAVNTSSRWLSALGSPVYTIRQGDIFGKTLESAVYQARIEVTRDGKLQHTR